MLKLEIFQPIVFCYGGCSVSLWFGPTGPFVMRSDLSSNTAAMFPLTIFWSRGNTAVLEVCLYLLTSSCSAVPSHYDMVPWDPLWWEVIFHPILLLCFSLLIFWSQTHIAVLEFRFCSLLFCPTILQFTIIIFPIKLI